MKKANDMAVLNWDSACQWWSDLPDIWTPVAWKDHLLRFNVFWSGMIMAQPDVNRRTKKWEGQGVQVSFGLCSGGKCRHAAFNREDDNFCDQGWEDRPAPVLWTDWPCDGVVLRQRVFAHVPGGQGVQRGDEPLFAHVRIGFQRSCPALPLDDRYGVVIFVQAPHQSRDMNMRNNIRRFPEKAPYPRLLKAESETYDPKVPWRLLEEDGRVRLGIAPGGPAVVRIVGTNEKPMYPHLGSGLEIYVELGKPGPKAHVDLLIPMLPAERAVFDYEMQLGFDGALKEADAFWKPQPKTAATFHVPEEGVNQVVRHSLRFAEMLGEKNPDTGQYCMVNGSLTYADLWTTPGSMAVTMLLDPLGYHDVAGKYLEIFRHQQGTVKPPGSAYTMHPGYLSTPPEYKSIDWLSDHGAVLYMIAQHALLSGDREFLDRFTDTMVKACQFIRDARAIQGHGGAAGLLPPAVATDRQTEIQAVWSIGWNYKGLTAAVKLLRQIGHPTAEEFAAEAVAYREAFEKAYVERCRKSPRWTDDRGKRRVLPPTSLAGDAPDETRHAFYLDTGPLFPVYAGLMDADHPIMRDIVQWLRCGPPRELYRFDSNCWQVPSLQHEMSSCEPCYSWNLYHSWQLGDRARLLEGLYSVLAGSVSRKTFISCETRGGITGNIFSAPLGVHLARLAMIDDEIVDGELHLLRLAPPAWLEPGKEAVLEKMPTIHGPVSLSTKRSRDGKTLDVTFRPAFRAEAPRVILHDPELPGLKNVRLNGKAASFRSGKLML